MTYIVPCVVGPTQLMFIILIMFVGLGYLYLCGLLEVISNFISFFVNFCFIVWIFEL